MQGHERFSGLHSVPLQSTMYYVRFLKSPQYGTGSHQDSCKALVTITTDLGDKFYHKDVSLHATLLSQTGHRILPWKTVQWRSGMRTLWLEINGIDHEAHPSNQTLLITPRRSLDADQLQDDLLHIVSARIQLLWPMSSDMPSIVREIGTSSGHVRIHEGLGDSIARHIWYSPAYFQALKNVTSPWKSRSTKLTDFQGRLDRLDDVL